MRTLYFPMTCISEPVALALKGLFGPVTVYLPVPESFFPSNMGHRALAVHIDSRAPFPEDGGRLVQAIREFKAWGARHYGDGVSLKKLFSEGFYNQAFTAQIRSDILKNGPKEDAAPDPLFSARLFLMMAHEHDARQEELDQDLARSEAAERELFARLNGLSSSPDEGRMASVRTDVGAVMPEVRLAAWARLCCQDRPEAGAFVTTSPAVMDQVRDRFPDLREAARIETLPAAPEPSDRDALNRYLAVLMQSPGSDPVSAPTWDGSRPLSRTRLTVHVLPDVGPLALCRKLAGWDGPGGGEDARHAVIVLCDI